MAVFDEIKEILKVSPGERVCYPISVTNSSNAPWPNNPVLINESTQSATVVPFILAPNQSQHLKIEFTVPSDAPARPMMFKFCLG